MYRGGKKPMPVGPRLEKRTARPNGAEGCWLWTGPLERIGYARICVNGRMTYVHRVAYELVNGPIPDGAEVMHRCDVRNCINPAHLQLGTHRENMADCKRKGRLAVGERAGRARITAAQAAEIRTRYIPHKVSTVKLGREYGISHETVRAIIQGRSWRVA